MAAPRSAIIRLVLDEDSLLLSAIEMGATANVRGTTNRWNDRRTANREAIIVVRSSNVCAWSTIEVLLLFITRLGGMEVAFRSS